MQQTQHIKQRMSQRGISRDMVELVLAHGIPEQDRYVLGRKEALRLLEDFQRSERLLKKILDKGGVVVVADGDALITTYNYKQ
ncbi:DUF4258 domain-containing protein [Caballeronia sp. GACF4]|uniref:DUF4258 domain-containing protein n=1 Tax=Caballeronia sp. GACF4 TaxID=2921763 RepID=UPI00202938DC|nr:DUF4258 domain-containing protein [Caballeronia sp. GACF4]